MLMFRSKKTKTEFLNPEGEFKDWKDAWPEIEALGNRLDAARETLKFCKEGTWAHSHWATIVDTLLRKWQLTVTLYQTGLRQRGPQRGYNIDYTWLEGSDEITMSIPVIDGITRWINERFGMSYGSLDRAWEMAREEKLQKARQGLA